MGSVFSGGGGDTRTSTTSTVQQLSPEQSRLINLVTPTAEQFISEPPKLFPRSTIVPPDPLQTQAQTSALELAGPGGPLPSITNQALGAESFLLGPVLYPESNPALAAATEAAVRPLTQNFERTVLPGIRSGAITAGQFGGSRQGIAEGIASEGLLRQIGDVSATVQANAFQKSLDNMTRALFAAPTTAQLPLLPVGVTEAVGAQRQMLEQAMLSEEAQRFLAEQLLPFSTAQDVAALAFGLPGGSVTSSGSFPAAGGGGSLASTLAPAALSAVLGAILPGAGNQFTPFGNVFD